MAADPRSAPPPLPPRLALAPAYPDVRSEIVRPDLVQVTTRYFWTRWAPKLGPRATALLLALRRRCYFNPETGERRDWCWPTQATLAAELGCERKAIMRALAKLEQLGFVRREAQFAKNPGSPAWGVSRRADRISVLMVEPLAPEDEGRAEQLRAGGTVPALELALSSPGGGDHCGEPVDNLGGRCDGSTSVASAEVAKQATDAVTRLIADESHNGTHNAVPLRDRYTLALDSEEAPRTPFHPSRPRERSTRTGTARRSGERLDVPVPSPRIASLVLELEERLADRKSRGFFVRLAQRLPHDAIRSAVSEAVQAVVTGQARGTAAAYFTGIVKRQARELGVGLEGR